MSFEVRITRAALADADRICVWIGEEGAPLDAEWWFDSLLESLKRLSEFPERCPIAPEDAEFDGIEIRHLLFGEYRALYTIRERQVFVLHLRHGKRLPATREDLAEGMREGQGRRGTSNRGRRKPESGP